MMGLIAIAPHAPSPQRWDNLWETTCFEFFLALADSPRYWEFNLSPAGHWNVYRFEDYRQGMQPETQFLTLPFEVTVNCDRLFLDLRFNLDTILPPQQGFNIGVATVIQDQQGNISYWALTHTGEVADFHRRDSFLMTFL